MNQEDDIEQYLRKPYHIVITRETNYFLARVLEFTNCSCIEDTAEAAMHKIWEIMEKWIINQQKKGFAIPLPCNDVEINQVPGDEANREKIRLSRENERRIKHDLQERIYNMPFSKRLTYALNVIRREKYHE